MGTLWLVLANTSVYRPAASLAHPPVPCRARIAKAGREEHEERGVMTLRQVISGVMTLRQVIKLLLSLILRLFIVAYGCCPVQRHGGPI
ncbi:MAG: hypothetical protein QJR12_01985 [Mycobacterium sp.]|uniref:hypothetical protein n=1 Tax=Mycobacterium sp. TaxID=1785 RepID=UPI0026057EBE|nr:hypothetical protein [Mycobacterium sp.]MDI3313080.1 hypothetical protein [Mycobacterium sp.]